MGTVVTNIIVCRMLSLLLILSTFFDGDGGGGPIHKILSSCYLCPPQGLLGRVTGPGGRRLRGRLPLGKSPFSELWASVSRHPNGFCPFSRIVLGLLYQTRAFTWLPVWIGLTRCSHLGLRFLDICYLGSQRPAVALCQLPEYGYQ